MIISKPVEPYLKWFTYGTDESFLLRYIERKEIESMDDVEIAQFMIKDWRGILDLKKNPVPCTAEFIAQFMNVLEGREIYIWAIRQALNLNNFVDLENIAKNSARPSNGGLISQAQTSATA